MDQAKSATVKTRVRMKTVKVHGPNSPDVLSGKVSEGHREFIEEDVVQLLQLTFEDAVAIFGEEQAISLFEEAKGVTDGS